MIRLVLLAAAMLTWPTALCAQTVPGPAAIVRDVIGDFRAPDVLRFGLTPLYLGFEGLWHGVDRLAAIMESESWRDPKFVVRGKVT